MFFKNLKVYKLAGELPSLAVMNEQLARAITNVINVLGGEVNE